MMIKKILVAVVAGTALMGGVAMSADTTPEDQSAKTVGEKLDDGMLTMSVKAALIASPDTKAYQINVETLEGVVRLIGAVDNAKAKDAASTVAMSVKGVKEVKNELDVKLN
jgi:hyperosmotically inducible protein